MPEIRSFEYIQFHEKPPKQDSIFYNSGENSDNDTRVTLTSFVVVKKEYIRQSRERS